MWTIFLDAFSSVWMGIVWAVLLFLYCSVGSAMPAVRQHPALEMTEFEWFHWWPFNVLIILLCLNLTVVTLRRIPFRLVNLGVWSIHAGIIVLCLGSYYYFGTKIEGDTPVFRRRVVIDVPGADAPTGVVALSGSSTSLAVDGATWRFQVQSTSSNWPILSEPHKGEVAYAVNLQVTPPSGEPFIRQLLAGYPQYTQDIIPGKGRAVKVLGRPLVDEELNVTLAREPQNYFHVMDTWALFVRRAGETAWQQRPIHGLPRYADRIGSRELVYTAPGAAPPLRPIDLAVPPTDATDALGPVMPRITAYLRYAHMEQQWRDGGEQLNPVATVSLLTDHSPPRRLELVALDAQRSHSETGLVEFRWLDDPSEVLSLPKDSRAMLHVAVPEADVAFDLPITPELVTGDAGQFREIEGTAFSYRIRHIQDHLVVPGSGRRVSVAMVEIQAPEGRFTRMVADQPAMSKDMVGDTTNPHAASTRSPRRVDPRIEMRYQPQSAPILLAAHPDGLHLVVNHRSQRVHDRDIKVGDTIEVVPGLEFRVDSVARRAVAETRPFIVPKSARRKRAGETFAMIRLELDDGRGVQARWLPFNAYALPDRRYAYQGRFGYSPVRFRLPDGGWAEILFSRQRRRLPNPIALDRFKLDTHTGGYSGQVSTIRNYVSHLQFLDGDRWTESVPIEVNSPTEYGGYWYFQSSWDKPPSGDRGGGMNYTGLGVGNRNGVYIQLAGCCLAAAGMLFAFYVKPILKRRRFERSRAKTAGSGANEAGESDAPYAEETLEERVAPVSNR